MRDYGGNFEQKSDKVKLDEDDSYGEGGRGNFLYKWKTNEILGRTPLDWAKLMLFWVSFCAILSTLWGLSIGIFFQTLDFYIPKYQQSQGVIGTNPGLGFRPMRGSKDPYSSLIWFTHGGAGNWKPLKRNMDEFLIEYEPGYFANQGASLTKCDFDTQPIGREEYGTQ